MSAGSRLARGLNNKLLRKLGEWLIAGAPSGCWRREGDVPFSCRPPCTR